jgi:cytochrome c-type biogenesis protein CcmH
MTATFWSLALLIITAAVAFLLIPLLRSGRGAASLALGEADLQLAVFQQQLRDLESDLANGALDQSQFERARADLERSLIEDAPGGRETAAGQASQPDPGRAWITAAILALLVPVAALTTYQQVGGGAGALEPARQQAATGGAATGGAATGGAADHEIEVLLAGLRTRLEQQPDPQGWALLARSLVSLDRTQEALAAYDRALAHGGDQDPAILAQYADLLAFTGHGLQGRPMELVTQALALDPDHPQALWLAGTAALQQNDHATARRHWERLLAGLPADSDHAHIIENNLRALDPPSAAGE